MRKKKLIFYLGGIVAPYFFINIWMISGIVITYIPFPPFIDPIIIFIIFPILGFKYIRKFHRYQLRKYIRDLEQSSKEKISSLAQNWWIFQLVMLVLSIMVPILNNCKNLPFCFFR